MGAGEQIPSLLLEKELSACRDRALLFPTDLEFLAEPREAAAVAFTSVPSTGAGLCRCSLHSCRDAAAGGGPVPSSPGTPPLAKPTAPSQLGFSFALGSREMGKVPGIVFPTPQQLRD